MSAVKDLTNYETETLKVLRRIGSKGTKSLWEVLCKECNQTFESVAGNITSGNTTRCRACAEKRVGLNARCDLTSQRFTRLLVIKCVGSKNNSALWECQCDCGNITQATSNQLNTEGKKSCGCLSIEKIRERAIKKRIPLVGQTINNLKVLSYAYTLEGRAYYQCTCLICGKDCVKMGRYIKNGEVTSCSVTCTRTNDWTGVETEKHRIIRWTGETGSNGRVYEAYCKLCNQSFTITAGSLTNGHSCICNQRTSASTLGYKYKDWLKMKCEMAWTNPEHKKRMREVKQKTWRNQFTSANG